MNHKEYYFLADGGEMGELTRSKDWSKTALSHPDLWPKSLQTMVSVMLNNPIGMYIAWGTSYIQLYNDAFRPILGSTKHPDALGIGSKETFSEIWDTIGPMFEDVMNGNAVSYSDLKLILNRNGFDEECYFNFSYTPIKTENGNVGGILVTVVETTEKTEQLLSKAKVQESEQKIRQIVENAPFPIGVYVGKEQRIELANQSIMDVWGKGNDVVGKLYTEILPELDNQSVFEQVNHVFETGEAFHNKNARIDITINGKLESFYFNYSFTPLYDTNGNIYGVMNTGAEITDLHLATKKIEEADKRFRNTVKQAPIGITILRGPDYMVEMANEAYLKIVDREESTFVGRPLFDSLPEVKESVSKLLSDVLTTGIPFHGNEVPIPLNRYGKLDISYFDFLYNPLREENGEISGIIVTVTEVSEKVETRKKIELNEERLKIIVEASELGTWELNLKENKIHYSQRYLEILSGHKETVDLKHEQLLTFIHPDDLHIRNKAYNEALVSGIINYELRVIWHDKSVHWLEAKGKVFFDAENKPEKLLGTIRDITDEKNHQQELEESEKRFRSLTESIPQLIWETDEKGNSLFVSGKWVEYTGMLPEEQIWKSMIHPDDFDENMRVWSHSLATGEIYKCDVRIKRYDGIYRWHTVIGEPVFNDENKIIKWVGAFTDIHTEKAFTNELEQQVTARTKELSLMNESLQKSEERYHLMVEEVQDYAILYLNHEGIVENWNLGAQKIKGYKAEEIIGKNFSQFYTESDRKNNLPQKLLNLAIEKGKSSHEGWRVRKDKTLFWANVTLTAIHNKNNQIIGFSKMTHDLTEKKSADDKLKMNALELEHKNVELEKMNQELQSFAYISSHDLQEPLRKIQTFATQIMEKESENLSDYGKDKFKRMQNAAQRMQTLINDLLSYSRTNIQERVFEKIDLGKIVAEVIEDLKEEIEQKNAKIESLENCEANIIPFQFRQLLYNLVSNSLKFSNREKPIVIKINSEIAKGSDLKNEKLVPENYYCHIRIEDNGIGFEQQYSSKIFEVFQRLHGKLEYTGTGIGLAIVKKIVDNHNGIITAMGELNKGAIFDIYIPAT
ncbi:PAS domain S-box protein [Flavobacterium sp. KACC 22761]|uniref:PAS domain S-box protein n=1 Tax=Flavobacterium sp. KACC 22761 TaxID=3092665 RepID=UPI002A751ED8|nr:PAS domain S-box protein [Flavobacterium sp. KACC 22761]WPO78918.1 PAS domain S-box protein [Flavobacterium sp. KACC 22761]